MPLEVSRLTTVTYGRAAALFLTTNTLNMLAGYVKMNEPEAAKVLKKDLYVDDLMTGVSSFEKSIELCDQL